jgi:hypothetical protein
MRNCLFWQLPNQAIWWGMRPHLKVYALYFYFPGIQQISLIVACHDQHKEMSHFVIYNTSLPVTSATSSERHPQPLQNPYYIKYLLGSLFNRRHDLARREFTTGDRR